MVNTNRRQDVAPSEFGPRWARWVGRFLARIIWDTNFAGKERIPKKGPVVLVANHIGILDGPLLLGVLPRPTHFLVKEEMFVGPIGWLLQKAGQISVDRGSGRAALQASLAVLKRGGMVGVFPEGVRGQGAVSQARAAGVWLAVEGGAAVVPVVVVARCCSAESANNVPGPGRKVAVMGGCAPILPATADKRRREAVTLVSD